MIEWNTKNVNSICKIPGLLFNYGQDKKKSPRNAALILDWIHIVIGFLVVLFAVIAFLNPEDNRILFPLIFLLAAVLNLVNGVYQYRQSGRDKKKKAGAVIPFVIAGFLLIVTVISAISIWR